ncbi:gamma-parvin-like [Coregonus clupeaformis]|uniref:gamma-parvin-like n=1 Tax=Coregonus clupeaformis TaxID=59861 RepID=UPI001E1C272E|nr:gamma-parvin-like [Coregonus clupeaformis]
MDFTNSGHLLDIIFSYLKDPKVEKLKAVLVDWINSTLKEEHIMVQSLEEDIFDGLILHPLLGRLAGVHLSVEEIAVTRAAQTRKLEVILEALNEKRSRLTLLYIPLPPSLSIIHNKDLLATLHLLVAMVRCFQPDLELPPNVRLEVVLLEAIMHFVNRIMSTLGLQVTDMEKQFADGVILLLLIGQLECLFVPLHDFNLTPVNNIEMLSLSVVYLDLLNDIELPMPNVDPQDIVSQEVRDTLKVLYALFKSR